MANVSTTYHIQKLAFPVDCYHYNVQVWRSVDGGKTLAHCGEGRFCKTNEEALAWCEQHKMTEAAGALTNEGKQ